MEAGEKQVSGELAISSLSDPELLANTRALIGRSNQVLAALLAHLGEVEARGLHRTRACSSLYAYCIYELRLSEDAAVSRVSAARLARRFPALLDAVAAGELHLTGLLMLGPHLTHENLGEVLARAKHRTKKEIAKLVRILDPLPAVPARIEALGPSPLAMVHTHPTWAEQVASFCPVRELLPGDRPADWVEQDQLSVPERIEAPLGKPLQYKVQFTATEEYVDLMERAAALLSNRGDGNGIEQIHLQALRLLVERLEKRRFGAPESSSRNLKKTPKPAARRSRHIPARVDAWCSSAMGRVARTWTGVASVAARLIGSSSIISCRSLGVARTPRPTSPSAAPFTTPSPRSSISAQHRSGRIKTRALTSRSGAPGAMLAREREPNPEVVPT